MQLHPLATAIAIRIFGDIGVGIATGFVVIILLIFGEIGPKIYATRASDSFALTVAPVILFLSRIFHPVDLARRTGQPEVWYWQGDDEPSRD